MAGYGSENTVGAEGAWEALRNIIATRKKDELLAQIQADKDREFARQGARDAEQRRQFDVENARLEAAAGITEQRRKEQEAIAEAGRVESTSAIGDDLTPDKVVALQKAGAGNAVDTTPIMPTIRGMISRIGEQAPVVPPTQSTDTGGKFLYGGTSTQKHQAASDTLAEQRYEQQKTAAEAAAARGDKSLAISERRLGLAEQAAQQGSDINVVERQPDGSYAVVATVPKGSRIAPNPETTFQRNQKAAKMGARGTVQAIGELTERINTGQGLAAKITGTVERAKATANLNDDVAEYESLIQAFTPLVARSLGHTGVLTEQDVQSVRQIFPKPTDSKSLRDRKIARLNSFFADETATPEAAPSATPPAAAPGETVKTWNRKTRKFE